MEPRARVSVWPGRRRVPGIVAPDSWGARGAECLPCDVPRRSSPATSSRDGTTVRRCLCHGTGSGTTEARPPASSVPPCLMGSGGLSRHAANPGPNFRSSSSSFLFLPEKMNRHRITLEKMNRHRITLCEKMNRHRITLWGSEPNRWHGCGRVNGVSYYPGTKEGHIPTRSASEGPMKSSESRRGSPLDD